MVMRSNGPIMLALPPFRGVTRRLVLTAMMVYIAAIVLDILSPAPPAGTMSLILTPQIAFHRMPWQFVTYAFLAQGLLNMAFGLLSLWFFGAQLEDERGGRWLGEYFFVCAIGGGLLASVLSYAHIPGIGSYGSAFGLWPMLLALLLAFARSNPDAEMRLYFVLKVKAKHLLAIFMLIYLASALVSHDRFSAVTALCVALCGFLYLRFAPRRGLQYAASESWFGLRNSYYRAKRRRAAKKFTVYMKKQGKDVSLDPSGRYVGLDDERRDPNDKRWMN
jgi:membrane associated rhomboid family serine protease